MSIIRPVERALETYRRIGSFECFMGFKSPVSFWTSRLTNYEKSLLNALTLPRLLSRVLARAGISPVLLSCFALVFAQASVAPLSFAAELAERDWRQFIASGPSGERLTMVTDLPIPDAQRLLHKLNLFDALVDKFVDPFVPLAKQIAPVLSVSNAGPKNLREELHLVVLRRRNDFNWLFRSGHFAAFTIPTLSKTTLVVGPMGGRRSIEENLLHEYVHYRLRRDVPGSLPLWFEEGLASFLAAVEFSEVEGNPAAARFELGRWQHSDQPPVMPLDRLISLRDLQGIGRRSTYRFYVTAHALVRYLYLQELLDESLLAASLVLGKPRFPEETGVDLAHAAQALKSLRQSEGETRVLPSRLDEHARQKSRRQTRLQKQQRRFGEIAVVRDVAALAPPLEPESLTSNRVRAVLADASLLMNPAASERLFVRALESGSKELLTSIGYVRALRLQTKAAEAEKVLARLEQDAGDAPAVLLERSVLSTSGCIVQRRPECADLWQDSVFALRDVLDAEPDNFEAIYRLGLAHLYLGQAGESLGYLEIAWQRVPWSARVNYFMGEAMRLLGDSRAQWYLQNARRWAASDYFRQAAESSLEELRGSAARPGPLS